MSVIRLSTEGAAHEPYISGYDDGTFRPDNTITRAEAATIIAKLGGIDESKEYENTFNDVAEDAWHKNYVNFAKEKGYIGGYDDNTFAPDKVITRGEFAVILGRYLGINANSEWEYMNNLNGKGIISGYEDGSIKPDGKITRAEAVTMINRALGREADINAQNPFSDVTPEHWAYKEILTAVN